MDLPIPKRKTSDTLKNFAPKKQQKYVKKYNLSMSLPDGLTCGEAFNTNKSERPKDAEALFGAIKSANGKTLTEQLAQTPATPEIKKLREASDDVIALPKDSPYEKAAEEFNKEIGFVKTLLAKKPPKTDPAALGSYLLGLKSKAVSVLKEQQKTEKTKLAALFTKKGDGSDSDYVANLKKTGVAVTDSQVADLQKQMTEALDKKHQEDNTKFEKAIQDDVNKLLEHANKEAARIAFFATVLPYNEKAIRRLAAERDSTDDTPASISINVDDDGASALLYGIELEALPHIKTLTGQTMSQVEKTADGKPVFQIKFPTFPFGLFYYNTRDDAVTADMAHLALAVRASGHSSVVMKINYNTKRFTKNGEPDQEEAREMGRKAYEGALRAGFPPDKISIEVNGKKLSNEELFTGHGVKFQALNQEAEKIQKEMEHHKKALLKTTPQTTDQFKRELDSVRTAASKDDKKGKGLSL